MKGQTNQPILNARLQTQLRNAPTDAERALWRHLKGRRIENCKFRRQHPYENYILDFACLERSVVVELDGSQHFDATEYDQERTRCLERAGFAVLRFWNNQVLGELDGVEVIRCELAARATPSPPNPSLEGEG